MTTARRERKSRRFRSVWTAVLAMTLGSAPVPAIVHAATTERIVVNSHTGLAIDGFDPVGYFVDAAPRVGRADLEFQFAGATWRFRNSGNRAAFVADPPVYMPRFGGHDPIAVARGVATPGHPRLWLIAQRRLYLFHSAGARDRFAANPGRAIDAAERHWPKVLHTIVP